MSFRLLAITPPTGSVSASYVDRWLEAAAGVGIALLLREVNVPHDALAPDGRLAPIARRARAKGIAVLWSIPAALLLDPTTAEKSRGVDGIQLRGDPDLDAITLARTIVGPGLLGQSIHTQRRPSADDGAHALADYAVLAPIFPPRTRTSTPKRAVGLTALGTVVRELGPHPVFALGGIGSQTAPQCVAAGASGLASIQAFFGAPDQVTDDVAALAAAVAELAPVKVRGG